ncbi:hypothetical protein [Paludibacterium yongneupense]|uniref:hypothetical protein n=1 Tax=Paludibacterium yongneupense TaxID=400061 RepID=UPI0005680E58|nr:hypothetical protein [Paludibacterium yongneupense]
MRLLLRVGPQGGAAAAYRARRQDVDEPALPGPVWLDGGVAGQRQGLLPSFMYRFSSMEEPAASGRGCIHGRNDRTF